MHRYPPLGATLRQLLQDLEPGARLVFDISGVRGYMHVWRMGQESLGSLRITCGGPAGRRRHNADRLEDVALGMIHTLTSMVDLGWTIEIGGEDRGPLCPNEKQANDYVMHDRASGRTRLPDRDAPNYMSGATRRIFLTFS